MKKRYGFLFPGQGSQYVGMGQDLYEQYPEVADLFDFANESLGFSITSIMFKGPEDLLMETVHSQLAIYLHSMAVIKILSQRSSIEPSLVAGLSLGEYTALAASNRISIIDGLRLVRKRGQLMNEACKQSPGAMAALLGLPSEVIEENIKSLGEGIWIANYNTPNQLVVAGVEEKVDETVQLFRNLGCKKAVRLKVFGAFHTPLMQTAQDGLAPDIYALSIKDLDLPLVSHVVARSLVDAEEIRSCLTRQTTSPTLWYQSCYHMEPEVDEFLELGPGRVLSGLNRSMGISKRISSLGTVENIEKFVSEV
ncbi:Malonyl CoA-acyl carrier protein transacylase,(acyl-carrier-protein) S-malonyltransferase,malonyl CoA-acyl carrier protein transacylase,Acyl transferase domain [Chlamydia serpentis]|uniref:Malonyl CoA-acyl carrier protein transacylase n=1 Tax=Chlamydia serpentis TaxID=1967782 RepID=A0A2R8FAQ7_9CHLA|nr:ACP S-malonyltransferase [Chlamydia serpentis]SPN73441.1 Malonyl CoA-acyl carrier protein transacylase,(acyl-carrier-protein) S-malonyltransferase,malonyl CoA-acyl carrier protein transacylase,Acyl transferase domain [Chlamydia serpentis]